MKITIDTDNLLISANSLMLTSESQDSLVALLDIKNEIDNLIEVVKEDLIQKMLELDKNIKTIKSDNIRLTLTSRKGYYKLATPDPLFSCEEIKIVPDTQKIEVYLKENKELPESVIFMEPKRSLTIAKINHEK